MTTTNDVDRLAMHNSVNDSRLSFEGVRLGSYSNVAHEGVRWAPRSVPHLPLQQIVVTLSQGRFSESLRLADVKPILKKLTPNSSVLSSYRPISNLPFISKVLERAVNERMLQYLHSNGLFPEHRSAYRRSHSTETALLKVTSDGLIAADQGKLTLLGMLDLSAAFDCVDHDILLNRLETSFGFADSVLDWMLSYLVGRRQYVRYNGTTSSTTVMKYGVPQGYVVGPLCFILYIADVLQIAGKLGFFIHGYADDLQIYDHCLICDTSQITNRLTHCIEVTGLAVGCRAISWDWMHAFENGVYLAGLDSSHDQMHLRSDHHQWRHHSFIANGLWYRCLHWFWHQFRWSRGQTDENVLFPDSPASVNSSVAYRRVLTRFGEGFNN